MKKYIILFSVIVTSCSTMAGMDRERLTQGKCTLGDCKKGQGVMVFANGDVYRGRWKCGYPDDNFGQMVYAAGGKYIGHWKKGMRHGQRGRMVYPNGEIYFGSWKEDRKHGRRGEYSFKNGEKYLGAWVEDRMDGKGILFDRFGRLLKIGIWKDGEYIGERKK